MCMKLFNAVPPCIVSLLKNQDAARDAELALLLDKHLCAFVTSLDALDEADASQPGFCIGGTCTLADVHSAPFLYRFGVVLSHYRGYDMVQRHPRLGLILQAVQSLPEWHAVLCPADESFAQVTSDSLVAMYALYANDNMWQQSPSGHWELAGRGRSCSISSAVSSDA